VALSRARERPNFNAYFEAHAAPSVTKSRAPAQAAPSSRAYVASIDPRRGTPSFFWAPRGAAPSAVVASGSPDVAAKRALAGYAELLGVARDVIESARVREVHDLGRGGIIVRLAQEIGGVEVFHGQANVLLDRAHRLVAASSALHPSAVRSQKRISEVFALSPADAVARAFQDLYEASLPAALLVEAGAKDRYTLIDAIGPAGDLQFSRPARVKKVYFPIPGQAPVPAYYLEMSVQRIHERSSDAYAYVIAADDARVLYRENLTHHAAFSYRVWAEPAGDKRPLDGPQAGYSPHPTGAPDGSSPPYIPANLVSMEGFNKSPDGDADPWLAADATETSGNNVDAYADHQSPDGYSDGDVRASTTSPGVFDRQFDTCAAPTANQAQIMAATTQLFYVTNWLHDYWYDSGFDEAAGNAQRSNFGRGGIEGDVLLAEAQDGGPELDPLHVNNANMEAGADGDSPRMQVFLFEGAITSSLVVEPGKGYATRRAAFGPSEFNVSGVLSDVDDGSDVDQGGGRTGTFADGCQAFGGNVSGKVVVIDRGACTFKQKAVNAEAAGAKGVIIADNEVNPVPPMMDDGGPPGAVNIPVVSVTLADGKAIRDAIKAGVTNATMTGGCGVKRDGALDNGIVAHEWGHYIHMRQVACATTMCGGESEGWGDFIALHMMLRETDDLDGTFATGVYAAAAFGDAGYFGTRRVPYSVDTKKNALTFKHISDDVDLPDTHPIAPIGAAQNAEVHNAGEVWATMLFEAQVALLKRSREASAPYTFEEGRRRMADYVVGGLKLAPPNPTFLEQRDAILAVAALADLEDMRLIAEAFARRGAGSCAISPPTDSEDNVGVVESFETKGVISGLSAALDDKLFSCDSDGKLDALEKGYVTVSFTNTGVADLTDAEATISAEMPGLTFPGGNKVEFGVIPPFATGLAAVEVALDGSVDKLRSLTLNVTVASAETCEAQAMTVQVPYINYDNVPDSSAADSVESDVIAWSRATIAPGGASADEVWSREQISASNHV
jgi:large repetitive protein